MSVSFYPFNFLLLKLLNKGIDFPFPLLNFPNKGRKEYLFIYLFSFISIPSSQMKAKSGVILWWWRRKVQENGKLHFTTLNYTLYYTLQPKFFECIFYTLNYDPYYTLHPHPRDIKFAIKLDGKIWHHMKKPKTFIWTV